MKLSKKILLTYNLRERTWQNTYKVAVEIIYFFFQLWRPEIRVGHANHQDTSVKYFKLILSALSNQNTP